MDDQNQQNPQTGGAQPVGDNSLPWMNFSPDAPAPAGTGQSGGTTADPAATDPVTTDPATTAGGATFDPFGNPFAAGTENVAEAFAPSTTDGSMTPAATPAEPTPFVPSEETAFTPMPETAAEPAPAEAALPWATHADITADTSGDSSSAAASDGQDSLSIVASLKAKFDEEEEEFNRQIEDHNANIQYEKEAINKLRAERSERLAQMREVVRNLQDMLGVKSDHKHQERSNEGSHDRGRTNDTRKAERILSKKPQQKESGINDFLAA